MSQTCGATRLTLAPIALGLSPSDSDAATGLDLVRALMPFQPTTQRSFSRDDTRRVYSRAYWRGTDATLPFEVAISDASAPVHRSIPTTAATSGPGRRTAVLDAAIPLSTLSPGTHVLSISARIGRDKPVVREIPIIVK